ncbi:MAG: RrF2 family transcriptional regulator [Anaerovoracaceae bacterium]|jgi:Rrf2 family protein
MKISTKGRYALRMMVELAARGTSEYTSLKEISKDQDISVKYLEQITSMLSKAGLIKSARGANGGHMLTRRPEQYTVGEILRVTEGSLAPVACLDDGAETCQRVGSCATIDLWVGLEKVITEYLDGVTLADLLQRYYDKGASDYVI